MNARLQVYRAEAPAVSTATCSECIHSRVPRYKSASYEFHPHDYTCAARVGDVQKAAYVDHITGEHHDERCGLVWCTDHNKDGGCQLFEVPTAIARRPIRALAVTVGEALVSWGES